MAARVAQFRIALEEQMGKKFNNVDSYAGSPAQIWAMLSDQAYWEGKYSTLGASNLQWKTFNASDITTKGAPGGTDGTMSVKADGSGSTWSADFDIKVSIPLLGKKLEGIMLDETGENFVKEKAFNDEWLASH